MRILCSLLLSVVLGTAMAAEAPPPAAATRVTNISAKQLSLFSRPDAASKSGEVAKESVPLPLAILDADEEQRYFKIELEHQFVWVKASQVYVDRTVAAGCLAKATAKEEAGAARGANEGCKK